MADTKIASLTDGTSTSATDRIPVAISPYGSGNNAYITPAYLKTFMVTGGTVTTSTPVFDMTQTWNAGAQAFAGLKLNVTDTASASSSLLLDMQIGSSSRYAFRKDGTLTLSNGTQTCIIDPYSYIANRSGTMYVYNQNASGSLALGVTNSVYGLTIDNAGVVGLFGAAGTAYIKSEAANTLALQNGTNAQTFNVYNTWSSAGSNYERMQVLWSSNVCYLKNSNAGTGSARLLVPVTGSTTVAGLPAASTAGAGARAFVTDASATTFLSVVSGSGSNKVPVVSDGTNWLIG